MPYLLLFLLNASMHWQSEASLTLGDRALSRTSWIPVRSEFGALYFMDVFRNARVRRVALSVLAILVSGCHNALVSGGLNAPAAADLIANREFTWRADSVERLRIFVESSLTSRVTTAGVTGALSYVDSALEFGGHPHQINVFVVASSDRMNALLGRRVDGRSFYQTGVAAVVLTENWEATLRHELTHVVLGQRWGRASSQWITEGIATWIGNPFYGRNIRILARDRLIETRRAIPLATLDASFGSAPDEVSYLQSASIAEFIRRKFGIAALREIWQNGLSAVPRATGLSLADFENGWRTYVRN